MTDAALKSFTSRKLDLMKAINADIRLKMSDRVVAHELLQYASPEGEIFPSQELIAQTLGLSSRMVKYCIAALTRHGWITVQRPSRAKSNRYYFDMSNIGFFERRRQSIKDELAVMRGNGLPLRKSIDGQSLAPPEGQSASPPKGNGLPPNTLGLTPELITLELGHDKKGTDLSIGQYETDADGAGPDPTATKQQAVQGLPAPDYDDDAYNHVTGATAHAVYVDPGAIFDRMVASSVWRGDK